MFSIWFYLSSLPMYISNLHTQFIGCEFVCSKNSQRKFCEPSWSISERFSIFHVDFEAILKLIFYGIITQTRVPRCLTRMFKSKQFEFIKRYFERCLSLNIFSKISSSKSPLFSIGGQFIFRKHFRNISRKKLSNTITALSFFQVTC